MKNKFTNSKKCLAVALLAGISFSNKMVSQSSCPDRPSGMTFNTPNESIFSFSKWPEFHLPNNFKIIFDKPGEMPTQAPIIPNPAHTNRNALKHGFTMINGNVGMPSFVADSLSVGGSAVNYASIVYGGFGATPCMSTFESTGDPWSVNISNIASEVPSHYDMRSEYFVVDWEPGAGVPSALYSSDIDIWNAFHASPYLPSTLIGMPSTAATAFAWEYKLQVRRVIGEFFHVAKMNMRPGTMRSLWHVSNRSSIGYWADDGRYANWSAAVAAAAVDQTSIYFNSDPNPQNNWGLSINASNPAPYYFKNPESTNPWQGVGGDAYVTYQLMQIEAQRITNGSDLIIPCLWNKYESFEGFYKEPITPYMAEAQVIFPLMAGADGLWFWGENYADFTDCSAPFIGAMGMTSYCSSLAPRFRNATGYTDASLSTENGPSHPVQTEDPYEHMVNAMWRLSQYNHIWTDGGGAYELVKPSDAFTTYRQPVWRGVRNGCKILIAAHNPACPVSTPSAVTTITVSFTGSGYSWSQAINLTGREVYLCEFDMGGCSSSACTSVVGWGTPTIKTCAGITTYTINSTGGPTEFSSDGTTWHSAIAGTTNTFTYSAPSTTACVSFWIRPTGCTDVSKVVWGCYIGSGTPCITTDVNNFQSIVSNISLFPNPAKSEINILGIIKDDLKEIVIKDLLGRELMKQFNSTNVNIESLAAGNYFIEVVAKNSISKTLRFVKE